MSVRQRSHAITPPVRGVLVFVAAVLLLCAGCTTTGAPQVQRPSTNTPFPFPTATLAPTLTPVPPLPSAPNCSDVTPGPGSMGTFPLPPGTISSGPNGAAGAGYWIECTSGATEQSIVSYLNAALPNAGWRPWNPQTQNANGCGTQANDYWKWYRGDSAVSYSVTLSSLPQWSLVFCSLSFGR
jgi:hypothetical protein